ncbi:MAG: hypothetical protein H6978_04350 [Gammaproteobacteria bacterium]|nr:hypothetical protein [Gammaproteobacteria bacterium]
MNARGFGCSGLALWAAMGVLAASTADVDAAMVRLGNASGLPGTTVQVALRVDDAPLDPFGLFTLDLQLEFDPALVAITGISPGGLAEVADFFVISPQLTPPGAPLTATPLTLSIISSFTRVVGGQFVPEPPGGGTLAFLDLLLSPAVELGQSTELGLTYVDSSSPALNAQSVAGSSVTAVVPIPAALWPTALLAGWLATRKRRANHL